MISKRNFIVYIVMMVLLSGMVFAWSTSNMGNVNVRGLLNASNDTVTNLLDGSLIVGGESTFNDNMNVNGNLTVVGDVIVANVSELDVNGSVLPGFDDTFNLGSSSFTWLGAYVKNLYLEFFKSNINASSYNISDLNELESTLVDTTNLEVDNIESNFDMTGYNITAVNEVASTLTDTTNLEADNLESNLDGTGYTFTIGNVIGATWLNGTNAYLTNLFATNLESDLDGTGFDVTVDVLNANTNVVVDTNLTFDNDGTDSRITSLMGDVYLTSSDDIRTDKDLVLGDDSINYELFSIEVNGTNVLFASPQSLPFIFDSNVSATYFKGDGSQLTGLSTGTDLSAITNNACNDSINMNGNNLNNVEIIEGNGQPIYIGDYSDVGHVSGQDDLYVGDELEVDGISYFNGATWHYGDNRMRDDTELEFGTSADDKIIFVTAQNPSATVFALGTASRHLLFVEKGDQGYNFAHPTSSNPTIFIHSSNQNQNQWLGLTHDGSNGVISTGSGDLNLSVASGVLLLDGNSTSVVCDSSNAGGIYYNDDTNKHYGCNSTDWNELY